MASVVHQLFWVILKVKQQKWHQLLLGQSHFLLLISVLESQYSRCFYLAGDSSLLLFDQHHFLGLVIVSHCCCSH